jgi:hypothetical protein
VAYFSLTGDGWFNPRLTLLLPARTNRATDAEIEAAWRCIADGKAGIVEKIWLDALHGLNFGFLPLRQIGRYQA